MTNRSFLNIMAFGGIELSSLMICLLLNIPQDKYAVLLTIIRTLLIIITIAVTVFGFIFRKIARCYLFAMKIRYMLLVTSLVILHLSFIFEKSGHSEIWVLVSSIMVLLAIMIIMVIENRRWETTLKIWQEIGKINIVKKRFSILNMFYPVTETEMEKSQKNIGHAVKVSLVISFLIPLLKLKEDKILLRLCLVFLALLFGMCVGKIIAFSTNLIKTEEQLCFKFLTEFADDEELERLSKTKL